jgi:hypothetical protein
VMAMTGDLRYVSAEDYQSFATKESEKVRQDAYQDYLSFLAARKSAAGVSPPQEISREQWTADHPLGYFERRDAFGPQGVYGRWLRQHNVAYKSGDIVFVHGGLSPNLNFDDINDLNGQMRGVLSAWDSGWESLVRQGIIWRYMTFDEAILEIQKERAAIPTRETEETKLKNDLEKFIQIATWLVSNDNPTWYRGLAEEPEQTLGPRVDALMARLKIDYEVVGHTVLQGFQIRQRFDNRVFLIDTGMLKSAFGGRASALEIQGGRFTAYSLGEPPRVLAPHGNDSAAAAPGQSGGAAHP